MPGNQPHGKELRKGRFSETGRIYLITTCCAGRNRIFERVALGEIVEGEMRQSDTAKSTRTLAYVVMPDHLHWMFELLAGDELSSVVRWVKGKSAHRINRRVHRAGRIWQPGYHDRALRHEEDLETIGNYVIYNPVRAGIVQTIHDYPLWDAIWINRNRGADDLGYQASGMRGVRCSIENRG